ncbi:hypothetical protein QTP88_007148 [Uroleucon formosanum]
MDTSDDVNILKILFEEEDDDDVLLLYLSEEKRKGHDQLFTKRTIHSTRASSSTLLNLVIEELIVERHDQRQPVVNHK